MNQLRLCHRIACAVAGRLFLSFVLPSAFALLVFLSPGCCGSCCWCCSRSSLLDLLCCCCAGTFVVAMSQRQRGSSARKLRHGHQKNVICASVFNETHFGAMCNPEPNEKKVKARKLSRPQRAFKGPLKGLDRKRAHATLKRRGATERSLCTPALSWFRAFKGLNCHKHLSQ